VDELSELLDVDLPNTDWNSVGGLVVGTLGRVPSEGDRVTVHGVELEVERMNGRRIGKVLVHAQPGAAESTAPAIGP
jgi:CBS domain containing-hemolysin-like protein